MNTKYGNYATSQIHNTKLSLRKSIFFLLLYVDPETKKEYPDIDVVEAFHNLQYKLNGINSILYEPSELVETMGLLEAALLEYTSENFSWKRYRKLILDAGAMIMRVEEGDAE